MNAVVFLLIAVGVSAVGGLYLWFKHRDPTTLDSGIRAFQREMEALAPPPEEQGRQGRGLRNGRTSRSDRSDGSR